MNATFVGRSFLLSVACAAAPALALGMGVGPLAASAQAADVAVVAAAPTLLTDAVNDEAGVLSADEKSQLEDVIKQVQLEKHLKLFVVFEPSFDGMTGAQYADAVFAANKGDNVAVFAVSPEERLYGVAVAENGKTQPYKDAIDDAVYPYLVDRQWFDAAMAAAKAMEGSGSSGSGSASTSGGGSDSGAGWLAAAGLGTAAAIGGGVAYSKRNKKKNEQRQVVAARELDPTDPESLDLVELPVLERAAHNEMVSTDEAIRGAEEELRLAQGEFGAERTAAFARRIKSARSMHNSYLTQLNELSRKQHVTEVEQRALYADIVQHCNATDKELLAQAEEFTQMRNLLINAPERLDELTRSSVGLLNRLDGARTTMERLEQTYDSRQLTSIKDNTDLAKAHLERADQAIDQGRALAARPAGQQAGLVPAIRTAENALNQADLLLSGIEHADDNIRTAQAQLASLAAEVRAELDEVPQWLNTGGEHVDALREAQQAGQSAMQVFDATGASDPLGAYTALMEADAKLDAALDSVKARASELSRERQVCERLMESAATLLRSAEDLISTRGNVIGTRARTALAAGDQALAQARGAYNEQNFRRGSAFADQARQQADQAIKLAQRDIDEHNDRQRRRNSGGSGDFITGMIVGGLLDGGRGGFSGGFGGGGFGGGFGGGGGWTGGSSSTGGSF
ncbi:TPM domain-containing protein [Corynebacterium aquilae]|uniref:TPM domain-containing protein n=1 Tax=Corynebacterium aquilae DSM 44791 TaxID=1431546 RepID=A0A1L7CHF5_9CORY|nr:TPM domain-containing protein [Corynebacterium aquilae]APT85183.1 hypothetical protein CAQU_08990 [Corynebacterium aquilae DSM 44791]